MNDSSRKPLVIILSCLAIVVFVVWRFNSFFTVKEQKNELKIGAIFTFTKETSYWSEQMKKGMNIAIEEENSSNTIPVELIYEDVFGTPQQSISAFNTLVEQNEVSVVLSVFPSAAAPVLSMADNAQVPHLASFVSTHDFSKDYIWSIRDSPTCEQTMSQLANYAGKQSIKSASAILVNEDNARDCAGVFSNLFQQQGGSWLGVENFEQPDIVPRSQLDKVIFNKPEAILLLGCRPGLGSVIKQLRESGFRGQFLSSEWLDDPYFWGAADKTAENTVFSSTMTNLPKDESEVNEFVSKYRERYQAAPGYASVYGYTVIKYVAPILREHGANRTKVLESLRKLDINSMRGHLTVQPNGDVVGPVAVYKIVDNRKEIIDK